MWNRFINAGWDLARRAMALVCTAMLLLGSATARGANFRWLGPNPGTETTPESGNWNVGNNWIGGAPQSVATTTLSFKSGANSYTATNNFAAPPFILNAITTSDGDATNRDINIAGSQLRMMNNGNTRPKIGHASGTRLFISNSIEIENNAQLDLDITGLIATVGENSAGVVSGTGSSVRKTGDGQFRFTGTASNTYTGLTNVEGGLLGFQKDAGKDSVAGDLVVGTDTGTDSSVRAFWFTNNQVKDTSKVTLRKTGKLDIFGKTETFATLTGLNPGSTLSFDLQGAGALTLTGTGVANEQTGFGGKLSANSTNAQLENNVTFTKKGADYTFVYTGDGANYKGAVISEQGDFRIHGWIGRNPTVPNDGTACTQAVARAGATISGNGWLLCKRTDGRGVLIENNGKLKPKKNSPGVLTMDEVYFDPGGLLDMEIDPLGGETSQLHVLGGGVVIDGAQLSVILDSPATDWAATYPIIVNDGSSVIGTFSGLPEGSLVTGYYNAIPYDFYISYMGGDGNDVVLYRAPIPEPGTLLLGALAAGWFARRRG